MIRWFALSIGLSLNSLKIEEPKYPILEHICYPSVRGLIAIGIGCDAFFSGISQVTPKRIDDYFY